jgi:hypothetical protein
MTIAIFISIPILLAIAVNYILQVIFPVPDELESLKQRRDRIRILKERDRVATMDDLVAHPPIAIVSTSLGFGEELWAMYGEEETWGVIGVGSDAYLSDAKLIDGLGKSETAAVIARRLRCRAQYWYTS